MNTVMNTVRMVMDTEVLMRNAKEPDQEMDQERSDPRDRPREMD